MSPDDQQKLIDLLTAVAIFMSIFVCILACFLMRQNRHNRAFGINKPLFRNHRNYTRTMLAIPVFPLDAKTQDIVDFCIGLASKSPEAFFDLYEDNLAIYGKSGAAYEATETTCVQAIGYRRFKDRDSFFSAYSNFKTRKADDSQGEKLG